MSPWHIATRDTAERQHRDDLDVAFGEADRLRTQLEYMATAHHNLSELLLQFEAQNDKLLKLVVAINSLCESKSASAALRRLQDVLVNLIGAAEFIIYSLDNAAARLIPITGAGKAFEACIPVALSDTWLGGVVRTGDVVITPAWDTQMHGTFTIPIAIVPLKVMDHVLGAIVIDALLPQRERLGTCDRDVLTLLGAYAATAIIAADQRPAWRTLPTVLQ